MSTRESVLTVQPCVQRVCINVNPVSDGANSVDRGPISLLKQDAADVYSKAWNVGWTSVCRMTTTGRSGVLRHLEKADAKTDMIHQAASISQSSIGIGSRGRNKMMNVDRGMLGGNSRTRCPSHLSLSDTSDFKDGRGRLESLMTGR